MRVHDLPYQLKKENQGRGERAGLCKNQRYSLVTWAGGCVAATEISPDHSKYAVLALSNKPSFLETASPQRFQTR